jgi:hypothetical protein
MPTHDPPLRLPVRGTPGGWRDPWDGPDDHAALRAEGEALERRQDAFAAREGPRWQEEIRAEKRERRLAWARAKGRG